MSWHSLSCLVNSLYLSSVPSQPMLSPLKPTVPQPRHLTHLHVIIDNPELHMINCKLSRPNVLQCPYVGMEIPVIIYVLLSMTSVLGLSLIFIIVIHLSHCFIIVMRS